MTKALKKLKKEFKSNVTVIKPNGKTLSLDTICNSTKIDKKIPTIIARV